MKRGVRDPIAVSSALDGLEISRVLARFCIVRSHPGYASVQRAGPICSG